jgi:hypothetical protein
MLFIYILKGVLVMNRAESYKRWEEEQERIQKEKKEQMANSTIKSGKDSKPENMNEVIITPYVK